MDSNRQQQNLPTEYKVVGAISIAYAVWILQCIGFDTSFGKTVPENAGYQQILLFFAFLPILLLAAVLAKTILPAGYRLILCGTIVCGAIIVLMLGAGASHHPPMNRSEWLWLLSNLLPPIPLVLGGGLILKRDVFALRLASITLLIAAAVLAANGIYVHAKVADEIHRDSSAGIMKLFDLLVVYPAWFWAAVLSLTCALLWWRLGRAKGGDSNGQSAQDGV